MKMKYEDLQNLKPGEIGFDKKCITDLGIKSALAYLKAAIKKESTSAHDLSAMYSLQDLTDWFESNRQ